MRPTSLLLLGATIVAATACTPTPTQTVESTSARNVILLIGDGVDDQQLTLGRNYLHGSSGRLNFEAFPQRATARVLTVLESEPETVNYVGDSASGGTALSAGVVTSWGRIATRAGTDSDVPTILEIARAAGKKTGVVSTASITDATPATFYSHIAVRFCEGPDDMTAEDSVAENVSTGTCPQDLAANGGLGSISEQLVSSNVDVALGGGLETFLQLDPQGATVLDRAIEAEIEVVRTGEELEAAGEGRVLGLFATGHLPVIYRGEDGGRAGFLSDHEGDPAEWPPVFGCEPNPDFGDTPTLATMTRRAIELLSTGEDGFVLMVESASIDKQSHAANPCGQIGEIRQLEEAVQAALDFQAENPDTLIVVASDHGHSAQIIPAPSMFVDFAASMDLESRSPGKLAVVETPEGGRMGVNYGTSIFFYEEHTGTAVPTYANGPGASAFDGMIDQTQIFDFVRAAAGI